MRRAWLRERRGLWVSGLVAVLVGVGLLVAYQTLLAGEVGLLAGRLERSREELARLSARRQALDDKHARAVQRDRELAELYGERFATERERFTRFIAEVKNLARENGLDPTTVTYPQQEIADYGLLERGAVFGVEGTYEALRLFINALELSDQFLMLQQLSVGEQAGQAGRQLSIRVRIATLFVDPDATPRRGRTRPTPPPAPESDVSEPTTAADAAAEL